MFHTIDGPGFGESHDHDEEMETDSLDGPGYDESDDHDEEMETDSSAGGTSVFNVLAFTVILFVYLF